MTIYEFLTNRSIEDVARRLVYQDTGASGPMVTTDGAEFWWDSYCKYSENPSNEEFEECLSMAIEDAVGHEIELLNREVPETQKKFFESLYFNCSM